MRHLLVAVFGLLMLASPTSAGPKPDADPLANLIQGDSVLAGLPKISLDVRRPHKKAWMLGATPKTVREKLQSVLRENKIPQFDNGSHEYLELLGMPRLRIEVDCVGDAVVISLELEEYVDLRRMKGKAKATTWRRSTSFAHKADGNVILRYVGYQAERFAQAWLKQNQKK